MTTVIVAAFLVALAAAVRGTWSPCGWSMYSTLTPLAEEGRGHRRWAPTAGWFVGGAVLGGAVLGSLGAIGAVLVGRSGLGEPQAVALAAAAFALAFALDEGVLGPALPHHRRQVDERWLDRYRRWVYAGGFGLQIGTGLATYVMTAGVYLVIVLGALTARPAVALAVGVTFGAARGSALLAAVRLDEPGRLRAFHRRFAALERPVRHAVAGGWALGALLTAFAAGSVGVGVAVIASLTLATTVSVCTSASYGRTSTHGMKGVGVGVWPAPAGPGTQARSTRA